MDYHVYPKHRITCSNCNKPGHEFKNCNESIKSYGIINVKIMGDMNETGLLRKNFVNSRNEINIITSKKYPNIKCNVNAGIVIDSGLNSEDKYKMNDNCVVCDDEDHLNKFWYYKDKIRFLMVSRNFSIGFIEFLRGRYDVSDANSIIQLFEQMYAKEIRIIAESSNEYDDILYLFLNRNNEGKEVVLNRVYEGRYALEYCESKMKFNMLKYKDKHPDDNVAWGLHFYTNIVKPKWDKVEWGFPKGRRDKRSEENIACACREFEEETGYTKDQYVVLDKIDPLEENLIGTNGVKYKHIYYLALDLVNSTENEKLNKEGSTIQYDKYEIGDIMWFMYDEAMENIRPYHIEKKGVLTRVYLFLLNYLIHNNVDLNDDKC